MDGQPAHYRSLVPPGNYDIPTCLLKVRGSSSELQGRDTEVAGPWVKTGSTIRHTAQPIHGITMLSRFPRAPCTADPKHKSPVATSRH